MLHILHLNKTLRYMKHALSEPIKSGRLISPIRNQLRYFYCLICIYIYPQVHIHCSSFQILPWLLLWSCLLLLHIYWTSAVLVIKRTQLLPCSTIYFPPTIELEHMATIKYVGTTIKSLTKWEPYSHYPSNFIWSDIIYKIAITSSIIYHLSSLLHSSIHFEQFLGFSHISKY
jgi:hypothetical protein